MKKTIFILLLSLTSPLWAMNASMKGFIALDLLALEKIGDDHENVTMGVGALDLKIYGNYNKFATKIKLDVDESKLSDSYTLFEEATVSYQASHQFKATFGKGVVPFHRKHWGVILNSIVDGGTINGVYPGWGDQDNKFIASVKYGTYKKGFFNTFTFFGDTIQARREDDGSVRDLNDVSFKNSKSVSTQYERGLANKFDFNFSRSLKASAGAIYYQNDLNPKESYAFNFGGNYQTREMEIWMEYIWGVAYKHEDMSYADYKKKDQSAQIGGEFATTNKRYSILFNLEGITQKRETYYTPKGSNIAVMGHKYEYDLIKFEIGAKVKNGSRSYFTYGLATEKLWAKKNGGKLEPELAYLAKAGLSFWF